MIDFLPQEKIRCFAALALPDEMKETLTALPQELPEARWAHSQDFHVTLRFLGDVPVTQMPLVQEALQRVKRPGFGVECGGLDIFTLKKQTILWVQVQSTRKLTALAAEINEKLSLLGFEMPLKPYVPHITLARLKNTKGLDDYIKRHGGVLKLSWTAADFGLYRSQTPAVTTKGRYHLIQSYPLDLPNEFKS